MQTFKTYEDLMTHYWGKIVPMAQAAGIKPWECVRHDNDVQTGDHPKFILKPCDRYTFALAILEGKPVFVGYEIYSKSGEKFDWTDKDYFRQINHPIGVWTWTPQAKKRTFMLGDKELPCPVKNEDAPQKLCIWGQNFYFDTVGHDAVWREAIREILTKARDKE